MKVTIVALASISTVSAYGGSFIASKNELRSVGKQRLPSGSTRKVGASIKMEDFGLFTGTGIGFSDLWEGSEVISEVGIENNLNKEGLRYRMNRTPEECAQVGQLFNLPGAPFVASIWEALGFTATSNNAARQKEKIKAIQKARGATKGVLNGPGAEIRSEWLDKYGYPRLVGSGGIFYADQLSTDEVPMGGFNMGKSGKIWPVPPVVEAGHYGGSKGWGMKKTGELTVDGLKKVGKDE
jgi:hypothetical protein